MAKTVDIQKELETIAQQHDGILHPQDVVEFAKNPETALHNRFEWDNNRAAEQYRLVQARKIIRVYVTVIEESKEPYRAFVSLQSDRIQGGGYRYTVDVLSDKEKRKELLFQALAEANLWRKKYKHLDELSAIFQSIDDAENSIKKPKRKVQPESKTAMPLTQAA